MQKTVKLTLKGKSPGIGQEDRIFMNLKKKKNLILGCIWPCPGAIFMYMTFIVKQVYWLYLRYQVSVNRTIGLLVMD